MSGSSTMIGEFFHSAMGHAGPTAAERPEDRLIARMQFRRTLLGIVAAVWLVVAYPLAVGGQDFFVGKLVELGISCGILVVGSIVGIAAFLIAGTPERRRTFSRRLLGPVVSLLALALGPGLMWLSFATITGDLASEGDLKDFYSSITGPGITAAILAFFTAVIGWLIGLAVLIASIPYTLVIAYTCVFSCFRTADVHQLLPALLSPLLVWSLFTFQLINGPDVAAPPEVLYTFMLGGPLSVTGLSFWEVRRLRTHHGITLRTALGR
ncbi:hypothetical protein [Streptomyces sp. NPDC001389]|uniref:hypothetical protein n=1 Tax=Streptomyces sp. NPDC001389 TaxID=3364569 RepID=UPI00367DCE5B